MALNGCLGVLSALSIIFWSAVLYHNIHHGPAFLDNLGGVQFDPPRGTTESAADDAMVDNLPLKISSLQMPFNVAVLIQGRPISGAEGRSSILTPEVRSFGNALVKNLPKVQGFDVSGYGIQHSTPTMKVGRGRNFYISPDNASTFFLVRPFGAVPPTYKTSEKMCQSWTTEGQPLHGYVCKVFGEFSIGGTAKDDAVAGFEHSDTIGIPVALVFLFFAIGPLALAVAVTLPIGVLCCFDICLQLTRHYPKSFSVPMFAPCILVSFTVAMSLDYTLFMSSRYRAGLKSGLSSAEALKSAYCSSGQTILISGLIMVISNLGALLIQNVPVRSLSLSIAVCCAVTVSLNLTLLPSLLFVASKVSRFLGFCKHRGPPASPTQITPGISMVAGLPSPRFSDASMDGWLARSHTVLSIGRVRMSRCSIICQEGVWVHLARLVLARPIAIIIGVFLIGLPVCLQAFRLQYSVALTAMVPNDSDAILNMQSLGEVFPVGVTDEKKILIVPRSLSKLQATPLPAAECMNDEATIAAAAKRLHKGSMNCNTIVGLLGCDYVVKSFTDRHGHKTSVQLSSYCPRSCPKACTAASILSRPFFNFIRNVTVALNASTNGFSFYYFDKNTTLDTVESLATLDGQLLSFEQVEKFIATAAAGNGSCTSPDFFCDDAQRYVERLEALGNYKRDAAMFNLIAPFSTFTSQGFLWVKDLYHKLDVDVVTSTLEGPVVMNAADGDYDVFFGDILNDFQASVDDLFTSSPKRLLVMVVVTVMIAGLLAFRSALIGPRLLLTVVFTISFTFGVSVKIFQDSGDSAGVHWAVLLVSVPIMLGLTLDYDIFLLSRCHELRLSGESTSAAIAQALQDTGPIITTAGVIMIFAFGSLTFTGIPVLYETGALLLTCCFMDTFVVRTLLVPAMMLVMVDYNWWPGKVPPVRSEALLEEPGSTSA